MNVTVKIKLLEAPNAPGAHSALLLLMETVNRASRYTSKIAVETETYSKYKLQSLVYETLKADFGLGSCMAQITGVRVGKAYANKARRGKKLHFRPHAAIPLDHRVFSYKKGNVVSIWTMEGRIKTPFHCHKDVKLSSDIEATLVLQDGVFYIHQPIEVAEAPLVEATEYLGVDLGIKNIAVDSDGEVFTGAHLNSLRKRNLRLRKKLQKKGTKSAKRLLKKRRKKEARFARDVNHCISKKLVQKAKDTLRGTALEDLSGIRERLGRKPKATSKAPEAKPEVTTEATPTPTKSITVSKPLRSALNSWSFFQLRLFVEYKSRLVGVPCIAVSPKYTSQRCSACGYIHKQNRKTQADFVCGSCGYATHADYNAACNIKYVAKQGCSLSPVRGEDNDKEDSSSLPESLAASSTETV